MSRGEGRSPSLLARLGGPGKTEHRIPENERRKESLKKERKGRTGVTPRPENEPGKQSNEEEEEGKKTPPGRGTKHEARGHKDPIPCRCRTPAPEKRSAREEAPRSCAHRQQGIMGTL